MRWFGLACFIILLVLAWRRRDIKNYAIALGVGCIAGFIIDCFGIPSGLWEFPRQPFMNWEYFLIVIPCWGVFGATINMVNDWYMKKNWVSILILAVLVMLLYEVPNLLTGSWEYSTSALLVMIGWIPLIIIYRLSFLLVKSSCVRRKLGSIWSY